jgi:hypothetical protein
VAAAEHASSVAAATAAYVCCGDVVVAFVWVALFEAVQVLEEEGWLQNAVRGFACQGRVFESRVDLSGKFERMLVW